MSAEYSVEEVRARFEAWAKPTYGIGRHPGLPDQYAATGVQCAWAAWQVAYASRIEADESAVPVATTCEKSADDNSVTFCLLDWLSLATLPAGTELFTHPPAQATQVESSFDGCTESNCPRCLTHPDHRGDMQHAGIGSYPEPDRVTWKGFQLVEDRSVPDHMILVRDSHASAVITATHPHSPDAADSGRVTLAQVRDKAAALSNTPWANWRAEASEIAQAIDDYIALAAQGQGEANLAGYVDPEQVADMQRNGGGVSIGSFSERYGRTVPVYFHSTPPASPAGLPDADDIAQLKKAVEDWNEGEDTDVPHHTLMRLTELGLLVADQFEVTKKGADMLAAAPSATPEGGEVRL